MSIVYEYEKIRDERCRYIKARKIFAALFCNLLNSKFNIQDKDDISFVFEDGIGCRVVVKGSDYSPELMEELRSEMENVSNVKVHAFLSDGCLNSQYRVGYSSDRTYQISMWDDYTEDVVDDGKYFIVVYSDRFEVDKILEIDRDLYESYSLSSIYKECLISMLKDIGDYYRGFEYTLDVWFIVGQSAIDAIDYWSTYYNGKLHITKNSPQLPFIPEGKKVVSLKKGYGGEFEKYLLGIFKGSSSYRVAVKRNAGRLVEKGYYVALVHNSYGLVY